MLPKAGEMLFHLRQQLKWAGGSNANAQSRQAAKKDKKM
jgi:hypothetical protein